MYRLQTQFTMKEFPAPHEFKDRKICMTAISDDGTLRSVRSLTNEPTPADGYLRFINDELFTNPVRFNDFNLRIVDALERSSVLQSYVGSYVLRSTS